MSELTFERILLEPEQKELLSTIVEASRSIPRDKERRFFIQRSQQGGTCLKILGLPDCIEVDMVDIEILASEGLIVYGYTSSGAQSVYVPPLGLEYYRWMKQSAGQPIQRVETEIKSYLNADKFRQRYPTAYQKWAEAELIVWDSDSEQQLTTIGHLCREAMQEFATALVEQHQPPGVDENKAHTKNRFKAVLEQHADRLGETERPFLDALIDYREKFEELVQRQEHGGQREKEPLVWEDGRRVVFQTAVVMYEIDKALSRPR